MQANVAALIAALFFGVVVFPWKEAVGRIGTGGVFLAIGVAYVLFGLVHLWVWPLKATLEMSDIGFGVLTAIIDLGAVVAYSYAVGNPVAHLPTISALVAAAPLFTLVVAVLIVRQPTSLREGFFVLLTVAGIWGLSFASHAPS